MCTHPQYFPSQGGHSHFGTVCSTWVWMCRHTTKRSAANVLGDLERTKVVHANVMVSRCALLMVLLWARAVTTMLEQPGSSLMASHPRMSWALNIIKARNVRTWLGMFGAATQKPVVLYSNTNWLEGTLQGTRTSV